MSISKSFSLLRQRNKASYQAQLHSESTVVLPKLIWQTCFLLVLFQKYITIESSFCVISFSRNGCAIGGRLDLVWIISIFSITTAIWYFAAIFFSDATVAQYTHHTLQWRHFHLHSDHYAPLSPLWIRPWSTSKMTGLAYITIDTLAYFILPYNF